HTSNKVFRVYNVYNKKRNNIYTVQRILQTHLFENRVKIILADDFNIYHEWWDANVENSSRRGNQLVEILQRNQFELINETDTYTHVYKHNEEIRISVLNLMFANNTMMSHISNWVVDCENHTGSDHMLIRFNIETDKRNTVVDPTT